MYKAKWGRFVVPDSLVKSVYTPQAFNRYSYVKNNPYKYIDKEGQFGILIAALIVVAVTLAVSALILNDFSRVKPPESSTGDSGSLAGDVFEIGAKTVGPILVEAGAEKGIGKAAERGLISEGTKQVGTKAIRVGGVVATVGFGVKDGLDSLQILSEYTDIEFGQKFPEYVQIRLNDVVNYLDDSFNADLAENPGNYQSSPSYTVTIIDEESGVELTKVFSPSKDVNEEIKKFIEKETKDKKDVVVVVGSSNSGLAKPKGCRAIGDAKCPDT